MREDRKSLRLVHERDFYAVERGIGVTLPLQGSLSAWPYANAGDWSCCCSTWPGSRDRFKEVNDTPGHKIGDDLPRHIGARVGQVLNRQC